MFYCAGMIHNRCYRVRYAEVPDIAGVSCQAEIRQAKTADNTFHLPVCLLPVGILPVLHPIHCKLAEGDNDYEHQQPRRWSHGHLLVRPFFLLHFHHMTFFHRHDHLRLYFSKAQQLRALVIGQKIFSSGL